MAHIRKPYFRLDLEHGESTCSQTIPPELKEELSNIIEYWPDNGMIYCVQVEQAPYAVWMKNETKQERLHQHDWYNPNIPVQNQGPHLSCWSTSSSENVSEARRIHSVDMEYTPYPAQYLMDFADLKKAKERYIETDGKHYCYAYNPFKGLQYAMRHGMPTHWCPIGCETKRFPDGVLGEVRLKHVLNDVKTFCGVNKALDYLKIQPILGSLAIFHPEFKEIEGGIYRGPTSDESEFSSWHTVSIRSITMVEGETIATVKNYHGLNSGVDGYIKVSMDVLLLELKTTESPTFPKIGRLFRSFTYGEVRTEYEKEVVEWYVDGQKKDLQVTGSEHTTSLILEGVFQNTSGRVFEYENGQNEIVGSPTDRAILKWAIKLQSMMEIFFSKLGSSTIKGSPLNSNQKCLGIVVNNQKTKSSSVRIHWKGSAAFILSKCTKYDSNGAYLEMDKAKKTQLEDAISDMAARKLICIAIAFKEIKKEDIPRKKNKRQQWVFSCEDLVLLAIFGIKNPCLIGKNARERQASLDFEDKSEQDASTADLAELADLADFADSTICPSFSEGLKKFAVGTTGAVDNSEEKLNYDQVFVRDFVPSALAFLMNKEPEIVRNFILKTLRFQSCERKIDRFQLGEGVMPASFKVFHDPVRNLETLLGDFGESAIGRVVPVDSGFWWIILLRAYTKSTECQMGIQLILSLCLSEGFDIFPTLLCADGCCMIDRRMGVYGYPIEIQALFYMALRCAVLLLKQDREGTEMVEQIVKRLHAFSYHMRSYLWLDFKQLNDIYRYKTEEYSHTAVNKLNVIPDSLPEWLLNYMPPHGGLFIGNVRPTRMDFCWFALGNCIAMLSSLATPEQLTAIMDLMESRWEELVGEMPLKFCYPAIESHEFGIVTGCDPKNTHDGGSWPALLWLLTAACIKTGRPQIARRAIKVAEARLLKDRSPEYYDGKLGRYKQARKCQTWSIAGYLAPKMMLDDGIIDTQFSGQSSGQATGHCEEEKLVSHGNGGLSSCAKSRKVDAMFEVQ